MSFAKYEVGSNPTVSAMKKHRGNFGFPGALMYLQNFNMGIVWKTEKILSLYINRFSKKSINFSAFLATDWQRPAVPWGERSL